MNEYLPTCHEQPNNEPTCHLDLNRVRHPEVTVRLIGTDGNAFAVLGEVQRALRQAGVDKEEVEAFFDEATSGDYDHLLATCMAWVNVE